MVDARYRARLTCLRDPRGDDVRDLHVGTWTIRIEGLDTALGRELDARWGPFLEPAGGDTPTLGLHVIDAGERGWLPGPRAPGEQYRMEARGDADLRVIVSYHFALGRGIAGDDAWSLAITRGADEPLGRILENATRFVLAVAALDHGGFAMHSAGVLHDGRAYLYAGPSRSGKSTAVAASAPAQNLGDDFGLVIPEDEDWWAPAVPFDGSERVDADAPRGLYPVGAIWRLYHSPEVRIDRPSARVAAASLLSCAAFPWAYPERAGELLDHVRRFVEQSRFAHLHFALDSDLCSDVLDRQDRSS